MDLEVRGGLGVLAVMVVLDFVARAVLTPGEGRVDQDTQEVRAVTAVMLLRETAEVQGAGLTAEPSTSPTAMSR